MRIGLYIPVLDDRPAGVGVYVEELCSRLARAHPDVVVYVGVPADRPWLQGMTVRTIGPRLLPPGVGDSARRRARRLRWLASFAARDLVRDGVDVFFSPVQEGLLIGTVPGCLVLHDLTALKHPYAYDPLTVWQTRRVLPWMLRRAARVIAVSQNTRRDVLETFSLDPAKVEVVGEGYDASVFYPRGEDAIRVVREAQGLPARYLLYAGTFSRHKNLAVLVRALAELPDDVVLALVGRKDAGAFAEFEAEVGRLGLTSRVAVLGYVSRDDLATLMAGASAFVYPSRYEGFGLAPLEAMACGAPVVASNVASLPEVVGEGGVLVDGEAPGAWAEAISRVLAADRAEVQTRAVRSAARFQWDDAAAKILAILTQIHGARHE